MGRSLEELRLDHAAIEIFGRLPAGPFASRALLQRMEIACLGGKDGEVVDLATRLQARWGGSSESGPADYLAGLSLLRMGRLNEGVARLESVDRKCRWYRFARYSLVEPYTERGESDAAWFALHEVIAAEAFTESDRRLHEKALVAAGDMHYSRGEMDEAVHWYSQVTGEFQPRAQLGLAWIAAERGDYEETIRRVDAMSGDVSPRWRGEAELLAGTCEARLARLERSADRLERALGKCAEWKKSDSEGKAALKDYVLARRNLDAEIDPVEPEIVAILLGEQGEEDLSRLDRIRLQYREFNRTIAMIEERIGPDVRLDDGELLRRQIREKAEFSLAQVRFEQGKTAQASAGPDGGGK